jgi:hypothetical protein
MLTDGGSIIFENYLEIKLLIHNQNYLPTTLSFSILQSLSLSSYDRIELVITTVYIVFGKKSIFPHIYV